MLQQIYLDEGSLLNSNTVQYRNLPNDHVVKYHYKKLIESQETDKYKYVTKTKNIMVLKEVFVQLVASAKQQPNTNYTSICTLSNS